MILTWIRLTSARKCDISNPGGCTEGRASVLILRLYERFVGEGIFEYLSYCAQSRMIVRGLIDLIMYIRGTAVFFKPNRPRLYQWTQFSSI